jgi:hypothetical protein
MKLTNKDLRRIIKEELSRVLNEENEQFIKSVLENLDALTSAGVSASREHSGVPRGQFSELMGEFSFKSSKRSLNNFTFYNAIEQLSGDQVQLGDEIVEPWTEIYLIKDVEARNLGTRRRYMMFADFHNVPLPPFIGMELILKRSGEFYFKMELMSPEFEEIDVIMLIKGQNLLDNLSEVLSYFTLLHEDLFEMADSIYSEYGKKNLPKTSLP